MSFRFRIIFLAMLMVSASWIVYLGLLQFKDPLNMRDLVLRRYEPKKEIQQPRRGDIYDRNGELLVSTKDYYQIDLDTSIITKKFKNVAKQDSIFHSIASIISKNTSFTNSYLYRKIKKKAPRSFYIDDNISETSIRKIKKDLYKLGISKALITTFSKSERVYSYGSLAARLLGMARGNETHDPVAKKEGIYILEGKCGLEAGLDSYLKGEYGWQEVKNDATSREIPLAHLDRKPVEHGKSVDLTLNIGFQEIVEDHLKLGLKKYKAIRAIAVFLDVNTGEILAMGSVEKDDLHMKASALRALPNLAIGHAFEPGSTMKPFVSLLALEDDLYKLDDKIDCKTLNLKNRTIRDAHPFKKLTFSEVIEKSSNVGICKVANKVGEKKLYQRLIELGFGHKTGSDFHREKTGIFRKLDKWNDFSLHSISFGQEMSATALQLANSYATLANGGKVLKPYIVKKIYNNEGKLYLENDPFVRREISEKKELAALKEILKNVVEKGTAENIKVDYLEMAGKTGTAEKRDNTTGSYSKTKYYSIFAGFFPVEKPQIAGVVMYDEPSYFYHYGSMAAAPTFQKIAVEYAVSPSSRVLVNTRKSNQKYIKSPDITGKSVEEAIAILDKKKIKYDLRNKNNGDIVVRQFPSSGVEFNQKNAIILVAGNLKHRNEVAQEIIDNKMPDLRNLTVRYALKVAKSRNLKLIVKGEGIIKKQSIKKGNLIEFGESCVVHAKF